MMPSLYHCGSSRSSVLRLSHGFVLTITAPTSRRSGSLAGAAPARPLVAARKGATPSFPLWSLGGSSGPPSRARGSPASARGPDSPPMTIRRGAGPPRAGRRRRLTGRDLPVPGEADEVIEAHGIESGEGVRESLQPPAEPGPLDLLPVIERVAPALAGAAEVVRRDAGDDRG